MNIVDCDVVWSSIWLPAFRKKCSPTFRRRKQVSYICIAYPMKTTRCFCFCVTPPPLELVDSVPSEGSLSRPPEPGIPLRFACSARNTTPLRDLSKWLPAATSLEAHSTSNWYLWTNNLVCIIYMNISSMFACTIRGRGPRGKRRYNEVWSIADIFVVVHLEQHVFRDMKDSYRNHREQRLQDIYWKSTIYSKASD